MVVRRCEPCCGMGYRGRWRALVRGSVWKIETCRACRGTGQKTYKYPEKEARKDGSR